MITSTANPKIKWVRQLQAHSRERREAGAFVVEGVRLVEEALVAGWEAQLVLYTDDLSERGRLVVEGFTAREAPVEPVSPEVLHAASDTETPQGLLAVLSSRLLPLPAAPDLLFIPDRLRDPGNLGTLMRIGDAENDAYGNLSILLKLGIVNHRVEIPGLHHAVDLSRKIQPELGIAILFQFGKLRGGHGIQHVLVKIFGKGSVIVGVHPGQQVIGLLLGKSFQPKQVLPAQRI